MTLLSALRLRSLGPRSLLVLGLLLAAPTAQAQDTTTYTARVINRTPKAVTLDFLAPQGVYASSSLWPLVFTIGGFHYPEFLALSSHLNLYKGEGKWEFVGGLRYYGYRSLDCGAAQWSPACANPSVIHTLGLLGTVGAGYYVLPGVKLFVSANPLGVASRRQWVDSSTLCPLCTEREASGGVVLNAGLGITYSWKQRLPVRLEVSVVQLWGQYTSYGSGWYAVPIWNLFGGNLALPSIEVLIPLQKL